MYVADGQEISSHTLLQTHISRLSLISKRLRLQIIIKIKMEKF